MAYTYFARRRPLPARASPERVIRYYRTYRRAYNESLNEFLLTYRRLWADAHQHGVTGFEGITRLIDLLPYHWQARARFLAVEYTIDREPPQEPWCELPGFVYALLRRRHLHIALPPPPPPPQEEPEAEDEEEDPEELVFDDGDGVVTDEDIGVPVVGNEEVHREYDSDDSCVC